MRKKAHEYHTRLYPSDVSVDEWTLVAPYLALVNEQALQRKHDLSEVYNALRWLERIGGRACCCLARDPCLRRMYSAPARYTLSRVAGVCYSQYYHDAI